VTVAPVGTNLLAALQNANHPITTSCGGRATCGLCRLTIVAGRELLRPVNDDEVGHLGNVAKVVDIRLACQAVVIEDGDIEIDIPPVVDVAARKREQTRRGMAERASRRNNQAGRSGNPQVDAEAQGGFKRPPERIEWRPRKLAEQDESKRRKRQ
jgi:ferredoxin